MAATSTSVSYLTIVVQGKSHDVVAPAGLTLAQVLKIRRVPPDLVPCTVAGDKLPGTLVVGREIRNGALVVLQPPGPDFEVTLEDFKPNAASPEAAFPQSRLWECSSQWSCRSSSSSGARSSRNGRR